MLVYYIVDLALSFAFLFCILQVTTNLQSSVAAAVLFLHSVIKRKPNH